MTSTPTGAPQAVREEAQCPECGGWFPVAWDASAPPGGMWWADSPAGCPGCAALICVESECLFRRAQALGETKEGE